MLIISNHFWSFNNCNHKEKVDPEVSNPALRVWFIYDLFCIDDYVSGNIYTQYLFHYIINT